MNFEYLYIQESAESTTTGYFQAKLLRIIQEILKIDPISLIDNGFGKWFRDSDVANTVSKYITIEERKIIDIILNKIKNKIATIKPHDIESIKEIIKNITTSELQT